MTSIDDKILSYLKETRGATDEEISAMTGIKRWTLCGRRNALMHRGLVRNSGRRRPASTGRNVIVWEVTP